MPVAVKYLTFLGVNYLAIFSSPCKGELSQQTMNIANDKVGVHDVAISLLSLDCGVRSLLGSLKYAIKAVPNKR